MLGCLQRASAVQSAYAALEDQTAPPPALRPHYAFKRHVLPKQDSRDVKSTVPEEEKGNTDGGTMGMDVDGVGNMNGNRGGAASKRAGKVKGKAKGAACRRGPITSGNGRKKERRGAKKVRAILPRLRNFRVEDITRVGTTASYRRHCLLAVAREAKESRTQMPFTPYNDRIASAMQPSRFELPDGTELKLGTERYVIPELLMFPSTGLLRCLKPRAYSSGGNSATPTKPLAEIVAGIEAEYRVPTSLPTGCVSVPLLCAAATAACDVDARRGLLYNTVLAGGGTLFPCFEKRMHLELRKALPIRQVIDMSICISTAIPTCASVYICLCPVFLSSWRQVWSSGARLTARGAHSCTHGCARWYTNPA